MPELKSVTQAAEELGICRSTVIKKAKTWNVGNKVGSTYVFNEEDMKVLRAHTFGKRGHPFGVKDRRTKKVTPEPEESAPKLKLKLPKPKLKLKVNK